MPMRNTAVLPAGLRPQRRGLLGARRTTTRGAASPSTSDADPDPQGRGEVAEGGDARVAARGLDLDDGAAADARGGGQRVDGHPALLAQGADVAADGRRDVVRGLHEDSVPYFAVHLVALPGNLAVTYAALS